MKRRALRLSSIAILAISVLLAGHIVGTPRDVSAAQPRGPEFPSPVQGTQPASRASVAAGASSVAAPLPASGTMGVARAFPFDQMTARTMASGGESRNIAHGTLATGESVNLHQSMQVAGQEPSPLHVIQHSEFILVREGTLEFDHEVDGKVVTETAGPGGVFYVAFGTRHSIRNAGSTPARYFVVAIGGDAK